MNRSLHTWAALAAVTLAACGGAEAADTAVADVDVTAFCDAFADALRSGMAGDPEGEAAAIDALVAAGPEEMSEPGTEMAAMVREDQEAAHEAELGDALDAMIRPIVADCPAERVDLRSVDYGYEGLPEELSAGRHLITFINDSTEEPHEAVLIRKNDGVTISAAELFELGEEEAMGLVTPIGYLSAEAGDDYVWLTDLEAGDYIVACFLPVGGAPDGPPHAVEGMVEEITVTG